MGDAGRRLIASASEARLLARIEQLEAERDAAHKRGLEEAAEIVERKHRIASDAYLREEALGLRSALNAIRAKIQENDG